jgi:hypothetical protein
MPLDALRTAHVHLDQVAAHVHEAHGKKVGVVPDGNVRDTAAFATIGAS